MMERKRVLLIALAPVLLLVLTVGYMYAQGPDPQAEPRGREGGNPQAPLGGGFTYQGQLKDGSGTPITSTCDLTFALWDAIIGGTQVGADSVVTGVGVTNGYFAALVNSGGEFGAGAFAGEARWLEIAVQCTGDPGPVALSPRQLLSAAPYALYALSVAPHDHWGESWSGAGTGLTLSGGDVGLSGSGSNYGLYGETASTIGTGVYGANTSTGVLARGVTGESASTLGIGVYGIASATDGANYGVWGASNSTAGRGVYGIAGASSGTTYGVYGRSNSPDGAGVYGYNNTGGWAGYFDGDVTITGAAIGFFPRPAYDSGWQSIPVGVSRILTHTLGGASDDYLVDLTCWASWGFPPIESHIRGHGLDGVNGAYWSHLTDTSISVRRGASDIYCEQIRVRIWVYR